MSGKRELSLARLALFSLGAAVAVLAVVVVLLTVLRPGPGVGLLIVGVGLVGAVAAMGLVSSRIVGKAGRNGPVERDAESTDDDTH